jgi:RimJ/RimL family protein N-acetyltransferase
MEKLRGPAAAADVVGLREDHRMTREQARLWIEPWSDDDLDLERRLNTPEMKAHLGGVETDEQILARHQRYLRLPADGAGCMFRVMAGDQERPVGAVGFWRKDWRDDIVYEMGWHILPAYQGRGYASAATAAAVQQARQRGGVRFAHAFPSVSNPGSNGVCRRLGWKLLGECDFEYPKGTRMRCNDWRLDLRAG